MMTLLLGDPAPLVECKTPFNDNFQVQALAGRFLVMLAFGSLEAPHVRAGLKRLVAEQFKRDDYRYKLFGLTLSAKDCDDEDVKVVCPDERIFIDESEKMSRAYGIMQANGGKKLFSSCWMIFDPNLRLYAKGSIKDVEVLISLIHGLPRATQYLGPDYHAPILIIPNVLEKELCKAYVDYYEAGNPTQSGFMDQRDGKTFASHDPTTKRRKDVIIEEVLLKEALRTRVGKRIVPEVKKAFNFEASRIERFIVACYDSADQGFFKMHRDNTTGGTAHRKFAVTINLNAEDYDGGDLVFPEYGGRTYRAPTGGAVVFGCSVLHEATPVTRGTRYATLPFLYDEASAKLRLENNALLGEGVGQYYGMDDRIFPAPILPKRTRQVA
jgi:predicted 2-oxoglutarate/Fe(II)-dependent dioxygenase YbiX